MFCLSYIGVCTLIQGPQAVLGKELCWMETVHCSTTWCSSYCFGIFRKSWSDKFYDYTKCWQVQEFSFCHFLYQRNFQMPLVSKNGTNSSLSCLRLHHRAGSSPLELHGTVYSVVCLDCGYTIGRNLFQDELKSLNPKVRLLLWKLFFRFNHLNFYWDFVKLTLENALEMRLWKRKKWVGPLFYTYFLDRKMTNICQ